jgi:hypothetical protein
MPSAGIPIDHSPERSAKLPPPLPGSVGRARSTITSSAASGALVSTSG